LKKEGEYFKSLESLCEVSLTVEEIRIGVDVERCGVLCTILVAAGQTVDVNEPIAIIVDDMDDYMEHVEKQNELLREAKEEKSEAAPVNHSKNLLRHIKMMIQSDEIDSNSDFAKELQALARKGNEDLISVFEASFESENFTPESFDKKFFLSNAEEIVHESLNSKKSSS
jgi:pyruvate/2-oxoglutarate dehydrogenase complex dihydrolipoamide acyltransferase (E2) component